MSSHRSARRAISRGHRGFDRAYYQRYYFDPRTAVASRSEMRARARLIAAFAAHAGLPVRRILDAGCGTGLLRGALVRLLPRAHGRVHGKSPSPWALLVGAPAP